MARRFASFRRPTNEWTRWRSTTGRIRDGSETRLPRAGSSALLTALLASAIACTVNKGDGAHEPGADDVDRVLAGVEPGAADVTIKQVRARRSVSPIRLESVDGSPLKLNRLVARADLDQPLAYTELEMEFLNPEQRPLDAWLSIKIPPGARVTRFAIQEGSSWRDAEVVPRSRTAFRRLAGEPREPAILRDHDSEQFRGRVFPVPANRPTRVIVSYVQEIRGLGNSYRLPLAGIDSELERLILVVHGKGLATQGGDGFVERNGETEKFLRESKNVRPREDLVLEFGGERRIGSATTTWSSRA